MSEATSRCERCDFGRTNVYSKKTIVPRKVVLCSQCFTLYLWARRFSCQDYESNPTEFLKSFIAGEIEGIPNDENFRRRYTLKVLSRAQKKVMEARRSVAQSFSARRSQLYSVLPHTEIEETLAVPDEFEDERDIIVKRIKSYMKQEPLWEAFFSHIFKDSVLTAAYIIGEIGSAQTLLCSNHRQPKPLISCGCLQQGKEKEEYAEAILFDATRVHAFGIEAFPSSSDLLGYMGLGLRKIAVNGLSWNVIDFVSKGGNLNTNKRRKSVLIADLVESIIRSGNKWRVIYDMAKQKRLTSWLQRFKDSPPPLCVKCVQSGKSSLPQWQPGEQREEGYPHWVCEHGHHFGRKGHVDRAAKTETAATILKALYHRWCALERGEPDIRDPLIRSLLVAEEMKRDKSERELELAVAS